MKHNWEYRPFDRVAHTITPISKIEKSEYLTCGLVPIISQEETVISGYWNNSNDVTPHQKPVVIFGDHSRVLKYIDFEFVVGADGVKIIEPKEDINTKFLYYYLHWLNIPSLGYARHFKLVKEALYAVPPKKIQEQIVAELDKINELIEQNRELLRHLDSLTQSLFYNTFGDPVSNPKGWPVNQMRDVAPSSSSSKTPEEKDGRFWLLNLDQIESNSGRVLSKQFYENGDIGNSVTTFDNENILYSKLRPYLNKVVIPYSNGFCTSELIPLRPKKHMLNRFYCAHALRLPEFVRYISDKTGGAKMPRVKMDYFWQFNMPIPPLYLQEQFATQIEAIEAQKATIEKSIAELQTLLDSRMDYWFN